ncbi:hypothetical protein HS125_17870 [bacterium]|nr:hypothetical protein [bacterium]
MDKRALIALMIAGGVLVLVVLLLASPKGTGPAPQLRPAAPDSPLTLRPAVWEPEPTGRPTPFFDRPETARFVPDATTARRELDHYTGGIAFLAPVEDESTRYALLQTKEVYGLLLLAEGEKFAPDTYIKSIERDRLIMEHHGVEKALPRRYKPYDPKGTYFDPDTRMDPEERARKLDEYREKVLPTLGRPALIMRELDRIRASDRYRIDGGSGPGPAARLPFAFPEDDVWYALYAIAHAWGVVIDVSRPVDGACAIPEREYTLPEVLSQVDAQCPTDSRIEGRSVYVEYRPRALSAKQGGITIHPVLRDRIERFYSPGSTIDFLLPRLAEQLKLRLELSPDVHGAVRLNLRNTTGLEILEMMLPQVGACYYIKDGTLYVEPAPAAEAPR